MKINPEETVFQRLCVVIGSIMATVGFLMVIVTGFFAAYENGTIIIVGLVLLGLGLLIARVVGLGNSFLG